MQIVINNTIANIRITDEGTGRIRSKREIQVSWMESIEEIKLFDRYNSVESEEERKEIEIEREEDESLLGKMFEE